MPLASYTSASRGLLTLLPWPLLLAIAVAGSVGASAALLHRIRRPVRDRRSSSDAGVVAVIAGMVLTLFALLLAFGIVTLYNQRQAAQQAVSHEADDLAQVDRDGKLLGALGAINFSTRPTIDETVSRYVCSVETTDFRAMARGLPVGRTSPTYLTAIFTSLSRYSPRDAVERSFYDSAVTELNDAVAQRRDRLESVNSTLPFPFALLLIFTALISVALTSLVRTNASGRDQRTHGGVEYVLVGSVAFVVAAGLLTALFFEFPFSGPLRISSHPFRVVHGCVSVTTPEGSNALGA